MSTKVHVGVDALGNPLKLIATAGQVADVTQGEALISIATNWSGRSRRAEQRR